MLAARSLRFPVLPNFKASAALSGYRAKVNGVNAQVQFLSRPFFSSAFKDGDKSTGETGNQQESGASTSIPTWKSRLLGILEHNKLLAKDDEWRLKIAQTAPPRPKSTKPRAIVITCMDTRLTSLIPAAMDTKHEEYKVIRTAGGIISHNFGGIMRSILIGLYELNGDEVYIIGHDDCGMQGNSPTNLLEKIKKRTDVTDETIQTLELAGIDVDGWLRGFDNVEDSVRSSVQIVRNHPLVPNDVPIHGFVIDPHTAVMRLIVNGTEYIEEQKAKKEKEAREAAREEQEKKAKELETDSA